MARSKQLSILKVISALEKIGPAVKSGKITKKNISAKLATMLQLERADFEKRYKTFRYKKEYRDVLPPIPYASVGTQGRQAIDRDELKLIGKRLAKLYS